MTIRPAAAGDWLRIGELAQSLVRRHHAFNPSRFVAPDTLPADAYTSHLRADLDRGASAVLVADVDGQLVGYVFAGIEPESWKELRHAAGYIHDLVVDDSRRHEGIGKALVAAALEWFDSRSVARVILWTAPQNAEAQRLFDRLGFRPTMIEMMRQL